MSSVSQLSAIKALQQELKSLNDEPVEGFKVAPKNEENMFEWTVAIFGPPGTLYEGGYFKATMKFPNDYPYSPPAISFDTKMWHPNIYPDGKLCISILHPPGEDPASGELPSERWNPTQTVRTVLLSVISLLNEPNTSSPANVDASVMFRKWKENESSEYVRVVKQQVEDSKKYAKADGVVVPTRVEDYVLRRRLSASGGSGGGGGGGGGGGADWGEGCDLNCDYDDSDSDSDSATSLN